MIVRVIDHAGQAFLCALLLRLLSGLASAQDLLPLAIGNRWDYRMEGWAPPPNPPDSARDAFSVVVTDTVRIGGTLWHRLNRQDLAGGRLVRSDAMNVYYLDEHDSTERQVFRFTVQDGTMWEPHWGIAWQVTCGATDTVDVFGERCAHRRFTFDGLALYHLDVARGIGITTKLYEGEPPGTWHQEWTLAGCILGGVQHGTLLGASSPPEARPAAPLALTVHPQPARGSVSVTFDVPSPSPVRAEVFDALGRCVLQMDQGPVPAGPRIFTWPATSHPAGIYLVRITAGGVTAVRRCVVVK